MYKKISVNMSSFIQRGIMEKNLVYHVYDITYPHTRLINYSDFRNGAINLVYLRTEDNKMIFIDDIEMPSISLLNLTKNEIDRYVQSLQPQNKFRISYTYIKKHGDLKY